MLQPLPAEDQAGPGIYYKVFWRRSEHDSEFQSLELKELGNVGITVVRILQEFYYTKYDVKVQVWTYKFYCITFVCPTSQ